MKLLVILFLVVASSTSQIEAHRFSRSGINDKLVHLIEKFKELLKNGNKTLGIPVLDPFVIENEKLSMNSEIFSGQVKLKNLLLSGLSNYNVEKADLKIAGLKLNLGLKWAGIKLATNNYHIEGVALKFMDVYGNGSLKINLENLNFFTNVSITAKKPENTLMIKDMKSEVSLEGFQFIIDGLFNDKDLSDMTNAIATDLVPSVIKTYQKKLTETINKVVITKANKILSTMTLKDLLDIIQGK